MRAIFLVQCFLKLLVLDITYGQWVFPDDDRLSSTSSSTTVRSSSPDRSNQGVIEALVATTSITQIGILDSMLNKAAEDDQNR